MSTEYKIGKFVSITCYTYQESFGEDAYQKTMLIALDEFGVLWCNDSDDGWVPHSDSPRDPEVIEDTTND